MLLMIVYKNDDMPLFFEVSEKTYKKQIKWHRDNNGNQILAMHVFHGGGMDVLKRVQSVA